LEPAVVAPYLILLITINSGSLNSISESENHHWLDLILGEGGGGKKKKKSGYLKNFKQLPSTSDYLGGY
jgi:hypothetical protein